MELLSSVISQQQQLQQHQPRSPPPTSSSGPGRITKLQESTSSSSRRHSNSNGNRLSPTKRFTPIVSPRRGLSATGTPPTKQNTPIPISDLTNAEDDDEEEDDDDDDNNDDNNDNEATTSLHHPQRQQQGQSALPFLQTTPTTSTTPSTFNTDFDIPRLRRALIQQWRVLFTNDSKRIDTLNTSSRCRSPKLETDIVSQGLISIQEADYRICIYQNTYNEKVPVAPLPPAVTTEMLREETPMLFLTIMTVTSGAMRRNLNEQPGQQQDDFDESMSESEDSDDSSDGPWPSSTKFFCNFDTALAINNQCIDTLMYEVMILGRKSIELLKCLLLVNLWYNTPEMHHYQKSHILTHMCITMAFDLGLGGQNSTSRLALSSQTPTRSKDSLEEDKAANRNAKNVRYHRILQPFTLLNPNTYECRKLWLVVYICSINVSVVLKRPMYMLWSRYTEECCELLGKPDRPPDEHQAVFVARLNRLLEQVPRNIQSLSPLTPPDVNDPRTQALIQHLETRLRDEFVPAQYKSSITSTVSLNAFRLFLHEPALYVAYSPRLGRAPYSEYSLAMGHLKITVDVARSIGALYYSSTEVLKVCLALSVEQMASSPIFMYSRIAMAVSILLKLRALYLTVPEFKTICAVTAVDMGYVTRLIEKLDKVADQYPFANSAVTYGIVFRILVYHYHRQLHFYYEELKASKKLRNRDILGDDEENSSSNTTRSNSFTGAHNTVENGKAPGSSGSSSTLGIPSSSGSAEHPVYRFAPEAEVAAAAAAVAASATSGSSEASYISTFPMKSNLGQTLRQAGVPNLADAQHDAMLPTWLYAEDLWKDLASGAEALSGFEMFC